MKIKFIVILFFFLFFLSMVSAQNISGVINTYTKVISFGSCSSVAVSSSVGYNIGDTVLVIQMKGASIDTTSNNLNFGSIINYAEAGNYEFNIIKSINGNNLFLKNVLLNTYDPFGLVQLIRVPSYNNVTVSGTLTAIPWNGNTGGVLVLQSTGTITLNADIDVSGLGFQGGNSSISFWSGCSALDYYYPLASGLAGQKGEGIADYGITYQSGRGALANGGGGGNQSNSGGAGGANFGMGGSGGDQENYSCITQPLGGVGGHSLSYNNSQNKIFLGGGGGGGHQNNNVGTNGTRAGGIIIIKANTIIGNNYSIRSNGLDNTFVAQYDGSGGAGSGGTILLDVLNYNLVLNIEVNGGKGGSSNFSTCFGTGGGGGGGVVWNSGASLPGNVSVALNGGLPGTHISGGSCANSSYGAAIGATGSVINNLQLVQSNIFVLPAYFINNPQSLCTGSSYFINGHLYNSPGNYYDTLLSMGGCDSIIITSITMNTNFIINNPQSLCSGSSYFINGHLYNSQGNYYDTLMSMGGCDSIIVTSILMNTNFIINNPQSLCSGSSYFINGHLYSSPGNYYDTLMSMGGCDSVIITSISINPNFNINVAVSICDGESYTFPDGMTADISTIHASIFSSVTSCDSIINTTLTIKPLPLISFSHPHDVCIDAPMKILNYATPSGGVYSGVGITNNVFNPQLASAGTFPISYTYTDLVTNCSNTVFENITVHELPIVNFSTDPDSASIENSEILFTDLTVGSVNWHWNFGDGTDSQNSQIFHQYKDTGFFHVSLFILDNFGCENIAFDYVYIGEEFVLFIPNTFSPNGDGINDYFKGIGKGIKESNMIIIDRWGHEIFETNEINGYWDGNNAPIGVYVYKFKLKDMSRAFHEFIGRISLIR